MILRDWPEIAAAFTVAQRRWGTECAYEHSLTYLALAGRNGLLAWTDDVGFLALALDYRAVGRHTALLPLGGDLASLLQTSLAELGRAGVAVRALKHIPLADLEVAERVCRARLPGRKITKVSGPADNHFPQTIYDLRRFPATEQSTAEAAFDPSLPEDPHFARYRRCARQFLRAHPAFRLTCLPGGCVSGQAPRPLIERWAESLVERGVGVFDAVEEVVTLWRCAAAGHEAHWLIGLEVGGELAGFSIAVPTSPGTAAVMTMVADPKLDRSASGLMHGTLLLLKERGFAFANLGGSSSFGLFRFKNQGANDSPLLRFRAHGEFAFD